LEYLFLFELLLFIFIISPIIIPKNKNKIVALLVVKKLPEVLIGKISQKKIMKNGKNLRLSL
tara:strand:+ start:324 stop:509 length:186 start_codon:yes stop_codon:yes gene_type:complete